MITTIWFLSQFFNLPPGDVKPGHIIFAPDRTNFMAPLSTCCGINKNGSLNWQFLDFELAKTQLSFQLYTYGASARLEYKDRRAGEKESVHRMIQPEFPNDPGLKIDYR
jgi:hypothetical protein